MSIGIFLDVDLTLTRVYIQREFAKLLGVIDDYDNIESDFQNKVIDTDEFGVRLIRLFNHANFSEAFVDMNFDNIPLKVYSEDILRMSKDNVAVTIYLVSSGPSYYVKRLAKKYDIPLGNVLCSEYSFTGGGQLDRCIGVDDAKKQEFVRTKQYNHKITIGIGDHVTFDSGFVGNCDIPVLLTSNRSHFYLENLGPVSTLIGKLKLRISHHGRTEPRVFISCASEQLKCANAMVSLLEGSCDAQHWGVDFFNPTITAIETLENRLKEFDFAIFFVTANDRSKVRDEVHTIARDNVIFELGMFIAKCGRNRCFLITEDKAVPDLPTNLQGMTYLTYGLQGMNLGEISIERMKSNLMIAGDRIKSQIKRLGTMDSSFSHKV